MTEIKEKRIIRTEKLPPEGGWGYLVAFGVAVPFICALSTLSSFGLMFNDFLTSMGEETSAVTIIVSCFFCALSFAGLFANTLFKKFTLRSVALFGGSLYFIGSLLTVFVTSVEQLMITFSVFQGTGFGFMIPAVYTTFNQYFIKRRVIMMSVAQSLIGFGTMVYPLMVDLLMKTYGFRGTIAVIAAFNAHVILGMLVMHPVSWHYKLVEITDDDSKSPIEKENNVQIMIQESEDELKPLNMEKRPRLSITSHDIIPKNINKVLMAIKSERSKSLDPNKHLDGFDPNRRRVSSISSLGNWTGPVLVSEFTDPIKRNGKWQQVVDFLDLSLCKDWIYVNIAFGMSFTLFSDQTFFTIQPMYLFELGFSKGDTAKIISMGATADLASRVFLAIMCLFIQVKARNVYLAGAALTVIARFVILHVFDFTGMAVMTAVMGFLRTWVHVPLPLVVAEYLSQERFPSGYGLFMFLSGNIAFVIGPFIGWIRDVTKSYVMAFHALTFVMCLCVIPWFIEIGYLYIRNKRHTK